MNSFGILFWNRSSLEQLSIIQLLILAGMFSIMLTAAICDGVVHHDHLRIHVLLFCSMAFDIILA